MKPTHFLLSLLPQTLSSPSPSAAHQNAFLIFNSLHSAMRQWGSSLQHNGMSFIPATVPRGTLFYHGAPSNATPRAPEWLAFEMEHAEDFARARRFRPRPPPSTQGPQRPLGSLKAENKTVRGYLHTFRTTRDVQLLYIDGTSAGKTDLGTVDSQDLVLRLMEPGEVDPWGDGVRAGEICEMVKGWGYEGMVRMEVGFEVIYCEDFMGEGLESISVVRSPGLEGRESWEGSEGRGMAWRWARGVAERYDGIGGGRVVLDFSRMVSALWYPLDVRNPDAERWKEGMPRLIGASREGRKVIRARVEEVAERKGQSINWQDVVDMVVTRYEKRLGYMASDGIESLRFVKEVVTATLPHIEFAPSPGDVTPYSVNADQDKKARRRCAAQYLLPVEWRRSSWTIEDEMIYTAIARVTERICDTLFDARLILQKGRPNLTHEFSGGILDGMDISGPGMEGTIQQAHTLVKKLTDDLKWGVWKKCRGCEIDEMCFVAMWPFGRTPDHSSPSCMKEQVFESDEFWQENYWNNY